MAEDTVIYFVQPVMEVPTLLSQLLRNLTTIRLYNIRKKQKQSEVVQHAISILRRKARVVSEKAMAGPPRKENPPAVYATHLCQTIQRSGLMLSDGRIDNIN